MGRWSQNQRRGGGPAQTLPVAVINAAFADLTTGVIVDFNNDDGQTFVLLRTTPPLLGMTVMGALPTAASQVSTNEIRFEFGFPTLGELFDCSASVNWLANPIEPVITPVAN